MEKGFSVRVVLSFVYDSNGLFLLFEQSTDIFRASEAIDRQAI